MLEKLLGEELMDEAVECLDALPLRGMAALWEYVQAAIWHQAVRLPGL